jgi:hypothetical protein
MRVVASLLLFSFICAAAESSQDRAKRIIQECVDALGGDRFMHMVDRVEEGRAYSFYHEQISGRSIAKTYTRYLPDVKDTADTLAVEVREYFGKRQESSVLFRQNDAYEVTYRGARPLTTERFDRYKETTLRDILYMLRVRMQEPGMILESRGSDVLDNRPVEIVDITDAQNRTTTVYFDKTNKWPVQQTFYRRDPVTKDRNEEVTTYTKYHDIGGVQWPLDVHRERNGDKIYEMFSDTGKLNETVKPETFMLPSDIKLLKPMN